MDKVSWDWGSAYPAPAKLNLFLRVIGRRADGYHRLQTLFRFIDRGDWLFFSRRADAKIVLTRPLPGVPPEDDLVVRAARLLQMATGCSQGIEIRVEKSLPMGGGLGGGSSNAATTLMALNHLWRLNLSRELLQAMGLELGADVPVFIFGRSAFAEGLGEALSPLELPPAWYVVLEPPVQVPTALIFGAPELPRDTPPIRPSDWQSAVGRNDLETVAVARFPVIGDTIRWLSRYGHARMTGSGACVFVAFDDEKTAKRVVAALPAHLRGWAAKGLDEHPLRALIR